MPIKLICIPATVCCEEGPGMSTDDDSILCVTSCWGTCCKEQKIRNVILNIKNEFVWRCNIKDIIPINNNNVYFGNKKP